MTNPMTSAPALRLYTCMACGGIDFYGHDAFRAHQQEKHLEPDAVDEKYAIHFPVHVTKSPRHDAFCLTEGLKCECGGTRFPYEELPRVVRELAAMLDEKQRTELVRELTKDWATVGGSPVFPKESPDDRRPRPTFADELSGMRGLAPGDCAICGTKDGEVCPTWCDDDMRSTATEAVESGPGITAMAACPSCRRFHVGPCKRIDSVAFLDEDLLCDDE